MREVECIASVGVAEVCALGSERESVLGFDLRDRRSIEEPVAFVGNRGRTKKDWQKKSEQRASHFSVDAIHQYKSKTFVKAAGFKV